MAKKKKQDGGPSNEWLITFSDCMTLLLCFFVMLLSFSAFDEVGFKRMACHINSPNLNINSDNPNDPTPLEIDKPRRIEDVTHIGSETPMDIDDKMIKKPKYYEEILEEDAYSDRRTFSILRSDLFWARGLGMTTSGRKKLDKIANFLKVMKCRVLISEYSPIKDSKSIDRAITIMNYFTKQKKVPSNMFSVSSGSSDSTDRFEQKPYIEITLIGGELFR